MKYRDRIKTLPCAICGDNTSTEAAHLRYSEYRSGKVNPGMQKKPLDVWLTPLCSYHHRMQHTMNERQFWSSFSINPIIYCVLLHQCRADINELDHILDRSRIKTENELIHRPKVVRGNLRLF